MVDDEARRSKSRRPKGRQLEDGAPRLLVDLYFDNGWIHIQYIWGEIIIIKICGWADNIRWKLVKKPRAVISFPVYFLQILRL